MNWGVPPDVGARGQPRTATYAGNIHQFTCIFNCVGPHGSAPTGISSARSFIPSRESFEVTVSGGSTFARVKLKEIDGMAPQDVERAV